MNLQKLRAQHLMRREPLAAMVAAALAVWAVPAAHAFKIDVGNPDLTITLDNTVRYNYAQRTSEREPGLLNSPVINTQGGVNVGSRGSTDEGNYTFDKGSTLLSRLDLFSELDVNYKGNFGLRLSAAGWYDHNFPDRPKTDPTAGASNYTNGEYSGYVKRFYQGPAGELLDAFVWGNFDIGGTQLNLKAGRFGWLPGEFLFGNASSASFSMAPSDGRKNDLSPGVNAKETVLPIGQVAATWQLSSELSVMGNVTTEFRSSRISEGGTFFQVGDTALEGPQIINPLFRRAEAYKGKAGDVALGLKWSPDSLGGDSIGLWIRRFDDKNPTWANSVYGNTYVTLGGQDRPTGVGRAVYARNIELIGLTYNTVLAGWGTGFEVNLRRNMPLAQRAGVVFGNPANFIAPLSQVVINDPSLEGPRGTTLHYLASGALTINKNSLFDAGSVALQLDANQVLKVTRNANQFNGNFGGGRLTQCANDAVLRNCSTVFAASMGVSFIPTWQQALPSMDISAPMLVFYGLSGNSGVAGGGTLPEGSYILRPSIRAEYFAGNIRHQFDLAYTTRGGRTGVVPGQTNMSASGLANFRDRDYVSFTYATAF